MNEEKKHEYIYSTEELDSLIEKMNKGVNPIMTDQMALEVKLRLKELQNELFDDDEDELDDEDIKMHQEMLKNHLEKKKREATKDDIIIIELSAEQKAEIRKSVETSIVRKNPNSIYNIPDEELYSSEEKRIIYERLGKLKNCYYNQADFVNAVKIIAKAVDYSLSNDYPWLSREEAYKQFHEGKIKFTYCNMPKLFINYTSQVTDPEILKGVITGKVTIKTKEEDMFNKRKQKPKKDTIGVPMDYNIMTKSEYDNELNTYSQGQSTLLSSIFKRKSMFNRLSVPSTSYFIAGNNNQSKQEPLSFDWTKEGAGERYYNLINNIKPKSTDMIDFVNELNNKDLNRVLKTNMIDFLKGLKMSKQYESGYNPNNISNTLDVNPIAAQLEQDILQAIRQSNPNI